MTSGKLFNCCLIVLGIFVAIVFGLGYAFSGSESSTTEKTPSHECQGSVQKDGTIIVANKYTTLSFQFHKGTIRTKLTHFTQMMARFTTRYCQACYILTQTKIAYSSVSLAILSLAILKNFSLFSIPMYFLPNLLAAIAVVPEPMKGSITTSPSLLERLIILLKISKGFWVG